MYAYRNRLYFNDLFSQPANYIAAMLPVLSAFRIRLLIAFIFIVFADKCSGNADNVDGASKSD